MYTIAFIHKSGRTQILEDQSLHAYEMLWLMASCDPAMDRCVLISPFGHIISRK